MDHEPQEIVPEFIGILNKRQRRVLGVLIEKSLTTPEYYPLTPKALTAGCNQKSNRSPICDYDEYDVEETLDELRTRGLVAAVQTSGGRTERFRHLLRDYAGLNKQQLAVLGELLLRGRQQTGELRSRASRMCPIGSLDELRAILEQLMTEKYVQATGDLKRRGIEVDHALYEDKENKALQQDMIAPSGASAASQASDLGVDARSSVSVSSACSVSSTSAPNRELLEAIADLQTQLTSLENRVEELERQLGV